jgi:hypothetical protein
MCAEADTGQTVKTCVRARDVLANRITEWVGSDGDEYRYADRLITDLLAAGWEIMPSTCQAEGCTEDLGAHCDEHGYVVFDVDVDADGRPVPGPLMGRMQRDDGSSFRGDIAMVLTVYDQNVAPENRGPWRHRLAEYLEWDAMGEPRSPRTATTEEAPTNG